MTFQDLIIRLLIMITTFLINIYFVNSSLCLLPLTRPTNPNSLQRTFMSPTKIVNNVIALNAFFNPCYVFILTSLWPHTIYISIPEYCMASPLPNIPLSFPFGQKMNEDTVIIHYISGCTIYIAFRKCTYLTTIFAL